MDWNVVRTDPFDFVVCGGGPSGFACALSAARKGLKTAIIEKYGCLGGTAALAGVNHLLGGRKLKEDTKEHVRVTGGIFDEITDALIAQGDAIEPNSIDLDFNPFGWYPRMASGVAFHETALKIKMEEMCTKAGIRIYYFTDLIGTNTDSGKITEVLVHNKDGLVALTAKYFADCTGDADLAFMSGVACRKGRESDGLMTPCSLIMHLDHVDGDQYVAYQNDHNSPKLIEIIERLKAEGTWKFPYEIFIAIQLVEKDVFMVNTIRQIGIDGTSEASVSKAMMEGRRESLLLFEIIKNNFPGFENARIRKIADHIGVRETRHILGRYTITVEDAMSGTKYEDCVAATTYNFDLPDPLRPSYDPMMGDAKNPNAARKHVVIRIPYRSLLPEGIDNLIVAGRCISSEREVLGPIRIMGPCMMTGQAAGTAVAQGFLKSRNLNEIDVEELKKTLWKDGVLNPDELPFD